MTIAVAGNPNCGKTTVFNALTGLRHKVGNYAGVTVERKEGTLLGEPGIKLLDLPGTYSLSARSPDEDIARGVLLGHVVDAPRPDGVLVVIDASNLERNLYLATQVIELGLPVVIACNMMDVLESAGHSLDLRKLSDRLGVPVIRTVGHRREGLDELRAAIKRLDAQSAAPIRRWTAGPVLESEIRSLAESMVRSRYADEASARGAATLLICECQLPDNHLPPPVRESLAGSIARLARASEGDPSVEITTARYAWLGEIVDECLVRSQRTGPSATDRIDRFLTHKFWGLLSFAAMMGLLFFSIFTLAEPLMGLIETAVGGLDAVAKSLLPQGALRDLLTDGVIAGVGNVIIFFPQICILFLFIALLEDTGYMARAAFLMDRIMSRVGLHGKSFIPLLSSHACAIPGIMATRTIENPRDRLVTILVSPLMSCSARIPVYVVLIAACLPAGAGIKALTMLAMYGLGIIAALTMATVFKKTLLKGPTPAFIMELPPYRVPRLGAVLRVMWDRSYLFLQRAGTVILAITIVLWALMSYPHSDAITSEYQGRREAARVSITDLAEREEALSQLDEDEAAAQLQNSLAGRLGHVIEPVIRPLGYDWKIGIGVIASFAAREVFVGTMGIVYSVGEADEESVELREQIRAATWPDGSKVFTPLVAASLMVFYVLACQCVSTIAVVRRETNSWRWPLFMFAYMSVLAYAGALIVYQAGSALGLGQA